MKKAIYKIENKINHKIYIGQSIHPEHRFLEHSRGNMVIQDILDWRIPRKTIVKTRGIYTMALL